MTRARDLADSADKDISGTLTLDGLTVGTDNTGFGVSHSTASSTATNLTFYTTNGSATAILEFTHSGHGLSVGDLVNVGSSSVTSWLTTWGLFDLTSIADEVAVTETTSTTFRVNITCTSVQTSSASLGQGGSYVYYKGTTTLNSGKTVITGGNVGLGTSSPSEKLHVVGNIHVEGNIERNGSTTQTLTIAQNTSTTDPAIALWGRDHSSYPGQVHIVGRNSNANASSGDIKMWNYNGSSWFNMFNFSYDSDNSDYRTTIESNYDVNTAMVGSQSMYFILDSNDNQTDRGFFFGHDSNRPGAATQLMTIKESGNVGIGNTNPPKLLSLGKAVSGYEDLLAITNYNADNDLMAAIGFDQADDTLVIRNDQSYATGGIEFRAGGSNSHMFIKTGGNVGIGTTSPSEKLHVYGSGQQFIKIETTTTGTAAFVGMRIEDGDGDLGSIGDFGSGRRAFMLDTGSGVDMMFFTDNQNNSSADPRLTITTDGKLLVNTANPQDFKESLVMVSQSAYLGGIYAGKVYGSTNITSGATLVHKLGQGQGLQFSGKFIVNSWTGNKNIDCHVTARYNDNAISVNTNHVNTGNVSSATVKLCTVTYDGSSWVAFVKDGGGSGVAYINALVESNIHYNGGIREVSGYTITTTHTTF